MARAGIGVRVTISMSTKVGIMVEVIMPELCLGSLSVRVYCIHCCNKIAIRIRF